ncbi:class A beta-lactamase [Ruegeria atlantica]|uniref:class A beta-lactamase n=1 Tax=Ruegeria atlantica TaxID=81569 RepID=UPI00147BDC06|nr:class A beta-lactamase [Ruegeria atlantica]
MRFTAFALSRAAAGITLGLSIATTLAAQSPFEPISASVAQVEDQLGARVGVALLDTGTGQTWFHRADERFPMNSTMKAPLCGAVLARNDAGELSLQELLPIRQTDIVSYAPVTEQQVGNELTISEFCFATLDISDNTAANLLIDRLGGPNEVTKFLRKIGDPVSRLDRREPELNIFNKNDPRDTTSPAAMAKTLRALLTEDTLSPSSQDQLIEWMSHGGVTGDLLRDDAPADWAIADKSGAGKYSRNIIALVTPSGREPWIVSIFISEAKVDFETRNAALKELGASAIRVMQQ